MGLEDETREVPDLLGITEAQINTLEEYTDNVSLIRILREIVTNGTLEGQAKTTLGQLPAQIQRLPIMGIKAANINREYLLSDLREATTHLKIANTADNVVSIF